MNAIRNWPAACAAWFLCFLWLGVAWGAPLLPEVASAEGPPVTSFSCVPTNGTVDALDTYTLTFETANTIPVTGHFRVTFPAGFDLNLTSASYSDVPRPNVPGISSVVKDFQTLLIYFDSTGTPVSAGTFMTLRLFNVGNPTVERDYSLALEILNGSTTLFGPTLSPSFHLQPGPATSLQLAPLSSDTLQAGESMVLSATAADAYGNVIESPAVSYRVVPDSLGNFSGAVFTALRPGTGRVIATLSALEDTSTVFRVVPAPLALWEISTVPAVTVAGSPLSPSPIVVTARDAFGNRQTGYTGNVYFVTGDPLATLPATASSPRVLTAADSGRVSFPGSAFIWRTAGPDSLVVQGGGARTRVSLSVNADVAFAFQLDAPDSVTAGAPFVLQALNVTDRFDNPASGVVTLFTNSSDSAAPTGQMPSLPAVSVVSGQGTSQAIVYKAGTYPIFGRVGDTVRSTSAIVTLPAAVDSFAWTTTPPVVSTLPVDSPFAISALDRFGNLARSYAQTGTTVTLSTVSGDSVAPKLLAPFNFVSGRAELTTQNFTYFGPGGTLRFKAAAGAASGTSSDLEAQAFYAESLSVTPGTYRRGVDTLKGQVRVRLTGSGTAVVTGLELITNRGTFAVTGALPVLPAHLVGPTVVTLDWRWFIPGNLAEGNLSITSRVQVQYPVGSMQQMFPDTVNVSVTSGSSPVVVSVVPLMVAYDDVRYLATITNPGGSGVSFQLDSSLLVLASGVRRDTARTVVSGLQFLGPNDTLALEYATRHVPGFVADTARPFWHVRGTDLGRPVAYQKSAPVKVNFTTPASLLYIVGSQNPDSLMMGTADTLRVRIRNTGGATVTQATAKLELAGARDTIRADVSRGITSFASWVPADTTLAFILSQAQLQVDTGWYRTRIYVTGKHNRIDTTFATGVIDSVRVVSRPVIRIDSIWNDAPRTSIVSTYQTYSISVRVTNTGGDILDSVQLALNGDGQSRLTANQTTPVTLVINQTRTFSWLVSADSLPNPQELFSAQLTTGIGRLTRQTPSVDEVHNFLAVQTQTASDLQVDVRLYSPNDALDGRIAAGTPFQVAAKFINLGQAATSGARLRIETTGGLQVTTSVDTLSPPVNVDAVWSLKAPNADTAALIIVRFDTLVQDLNTTQPALTSRVADTIPVRIAFEAPPLRVLNVQTAGGAVDSPYTPLSWSWANDDPTGLFPILVRQVVVEATGSDGVTALDAASIVEGAQLILPGVTLPGVISGSRIEFGIDSIARVAPGTQSPVSVRIVPRLSGSLAEFHWVTRGVNWSAVERSVGGAGLTVPVFDERGVPLYVESEMAFVPGSTAANYPNPFRAGSEVTHIQYDLSQAAQVQIDIYTVSGHEVWTHQAQAGSPGGRAGPNTVDWDGRNTQGNVVIDGVYLARLVTGAGESTIKIVVMK